jgi:glucose/arabinose dehydrogenase
MITALPLHHAHAISAAKEDAFTLEELVHDLDTVWGMAFLSSTEIIFTEKSGDISVLNLKDRSVTGLSGTPEVKHADQGGMLDVAVLPGYTESDWIYFTYSKPVGKMGVTALARARRSGNALIDWKDILITRSATDADHHYGSRIAFDDAGHVFFSVGDRGVRPNAQDLSNHAGKVLRLNLDGTVPDDNPFSSVSGARAEIYSYGHRNPQGLVYDRNTGRLWLIEHGPRGGDEINLITAGANYGWPIISHGKEYYAPIAVGEGTEKEGMESPLKVYIPSIAPGSLMLYSGRAFPKWRGNLFAGALVLRHINRVTLDDNGQPVEEERLLESLNERIRALIEGPEGYIYFSTDSGRIFRLRPD